MRVGNISINNTLKGILIFLGLVNIVSLISVFISFTDLDNEIKVATRNSALSQKMTLHANLYVNGHQNSKAISQSALELYGRSTDALKNGGKVPGFNNISLNKAEGSNLRILNNLDSTWQDYRRNMLNILNEPLTEQSGEGVNPVVSESLEYINNNSAALLDNNNDLVQTYIEESNAAQNTSKNILITSFFVTVLIVLSSVAYVNRIVAKPLNHLINKIKNLAHGDYDEDVDLRGKNEFGKLGDFLSTVFNKFRLAATFIEEIGKGNLSYQLDEASQNEFKDDRFFVALTKTREELKNIEEQNKIRQWSNEGISIVSELLQKRYEDIQNLYDDLISTIIKYIDANQGGLFIKSEKEEKDCLELIGCYAYERKKYLHETYDIEEGLLGQSYKEGDLILLTEVPQNYVRITSGLGSSTPQCLVLVPLIDNENKVGVLEIALFEKIKDYKVEFLKKIAEIIASALHSIMINEQTKQLLSESQQQAEEMRAQEEEMRQNMEELSATQEEMDRVMKEVQDKEAFMNDLINATNDVIFAIDKDYKLVTCNETFKNAYQDQGVAIEQGFDALSLFPDKKEREIHKKYYDRALKGEYFDELETFNIEGGQKHFNVSYGPIKNKDGQIVAAAAFTKDVTELENNRQENEKLLQDAKQQTEELRAQEEEMRQNMEEMQATQEEMARKEQEASRLLEEANSSRKELELENAMFMGLMDNLPDRVTIKDKKGVYLRVNKTKMDSLASQGITQVTGKSDKEIFDEKHYQEALKIEKAIMDSGKPELNKESKIVMPDGSIMWGATTRAPYKNKNGEVLGTIAVTRDVTKEKQCEEKLEKVSKEKDALKKQIKK